MPQKSILGLIIVVVINVALACFVVLQPALASQLHEPVLPARTVAQAQSVPAAQGSSLNASPTLVDVGSQITFTLTATQFTPHSSVLIRFLSAHHGYSGAMPWDVRCGCFRLAVFLAQRVHPLETARATAVITAGKNVSMVYSVFQIRGLAPNRREYAGGGSPILTTWVGDPTPVQTEFQHYCVWARTSDALGIPGLKVRLSVHFSQHTENWTAGTTGPSGVLCVRRSIGHPVVGLPVQVYAYAGALQAHTSFTPLT